MSEGAHIVVCDDEPDIRDMVREYLERQGFRVTPAENGAVLRKLTAQHEIDLVVLDITMPGEDGLSLARFLRQSTEVGIVMLTASGETVDRVVGLEMGADDYLSKPVDLRELLARIRAVLRRVSRERVQAIARTDGKTAGRARFGDCMLDLDSHKLFGRDGNEIAITAMEFALLKTFAEHPNRVLNRDQLLEYAHHRTWDPFDRSIDIRISRLRRKIEKDPAKPQVIKTIRGTGYLYSPAGE